MAEESPLRADDGELNEYEYEWLAAHTQPDGVLGHPSDPSPVVSAGTQVNVKAGFRAVVRGFPWYSGTVDWSPVMPSLAGSARTDLVVLRLRRDDQFQVEVAIREGTPGSGAPVPWTGTGPTDWYEFPLIEYDVAGGAIVSTRRRCWYLGEDGQIYCTSTSLPPHKSGREIVRSDLNEVHKSINGKWVVVLADSGDVTLPLEGLFTASRNYLRRRNRSGYMALTFRRPGGALAARTTYEVGRIPQGLRPAFSFDAIAASTQPVIATAAVRTDGVVTIRPTAQINAGDSIVLGPLSWPLAE